MVAIPDSVRALIAEGHLAHFVTINPDGSPQVTGVWLGVDGDELVTAHLGAWQKVKNVQKDPRIVISMESGRHNAAGLSEYLIVYGRATVTAGGAAPLLQQLAHIYMGPDVKFPRTDNPPPGYVLRITPERFGGVGPWAERGR
ncbi:MAG: PPOX class F420-dependent oxidoreductase [Chloroflexota bacterium]